MDERHECDFLEVEVHTGENLALDFRVLFLLETVI
jgi:hypothetical protein